MAVATAVGPTAGFGRTSNAWPRCSATAGTAPPTRCTAARSPAWSRRQGWCGAATEFLERDDAAPREVSPASTSARPEAEPRSPGQDHVIGLHLRRARE